MNYVVNFLDGNGRDSFQFLGDSDVDARSTFDEFLQEEKEEGCQLVWAQLARVDPPAVLQNVGPGPWLDDFDP